jgi:cysteine synthase
VVNAFGSVLDAIGGTPPVRLNRITAGLPAQVWAKLEFANPGGSVCTGPGW